MDKAVEEIFQIYKVSIIQAKTFILMDLGFFLVVRIFALSQLVIDKDD
jgi:hypothetical protein